jgi:hypothetical protein
LCGDAEEELVLFSERLLLVSGQISTLLGLESHVGICDFGNGAEEEDDGEQEDEGGNADVCPLHL